jgi:replicative DNA helicase
MTNPAVSTIWNPEAEASVLAAIMADNELMDECMQLQVNDFYIEDYKIIYKAMQRLYEENKPIDIVTLAETSGVKGSVIAEISQSFISKSTFKHHVKIIINNSTKRSITQIASELIN